MLRVHHWLGAVFLGVAVLAASNNSGAAARKHTVESGDSLWKIAQRYDVSVDAIRAKNDLDEDTAIRPGQVLVIPEPGAAPKREPRDGERGGAKQKESERGDADAGRRGTSGKVPGWVVRKPAASTQTQKTPAERGGVNPCMTADPGWGIYDRWSRAPSMGQMIMPGRGGVTADGRFDVMFHFHGHEAVRKEWVRVMDGAVLVGIDLGIGSGPYANAFASPRAFEQLVKSVERAVAEKTGKKNARVRRVGLSGWSAGYGSVGAIIDQEYGRRVVDTVVLLDGLHAGYNGASLDDNQMKPFLDFARQAKAGRKLMFVSHSSIIPPGYASTTETANYLIYKLGGRPSKSSGAGPSGLEQISRYQSGNFHVRGYRGNDKMDHCAHIGLYRDILKIRVKPRWRSPKGYARKE